MTLRELREARKWTQEDLEAKSGVPQATISQIERGGTDDPRGYTLAALAKALEITIEELMDVIKETNAAA